MKKQTIQTIDIIKDNSVIETVFTISTAAQMFVLHNANYCLLTQIKWDNEGNATISKERLIFNN